MRRSNQGPRAVAPGLLRCARNDGGASPNGNRELHRKIWLRKAFVRSCLGASKNSAGALISTISPWSMKTTAIGDLAGEAHLVGDDDHRHAVLRQGGHRIQHFLDHFGIERRGRLVEQHDLRVHAEGARDRDALLLAAGELARVFVRLLGDFDSAEELHRDLLGLAPGHLAHPDRRQRAILEDGQMREQVELLEHHADFASDLVDALQVGRSVRCRRRGSCRADAPPAG